MTIMRATTFGIGMFLASLVTHNAHAQGSSYYSATFSAVGCTPKNALAARYTARTAHSIKNKGPRWIDFVCPITLESSFDGALRECNDEIETNSYVIGSNIEFWMRSSTDGSPPVKPTAWLVLTARSYTPITPELKRTRGVKARLSLTAVDAQYVRAFASPYHICRTVPFSIQSASLQLRLPAGAEVASYSVYVGVD